MPSWIRPLLVVVCVWLSGIAYADEPEVDCSNPRAAADTLFVFLSPDAFHPHRAAACMDVPEGMNPARVAVQFKHVLDGQRIYMPVPSMPANPDHRNEEGNAQVVPLPEEAPWISLERTEDGDWAYSRSTVNKVPQLYRSTFSPLSRFLQTGLWHGFYSITLFGVALWQFLYLAILVGTAWIVGRIANSLLRSRFAALLQRGGMKLEKRTWHRTTGPLVVLAMGIVLLWGIPDLALPIDLSIALYELVRLAVMAAAIVWVVRLVDVIAQVASSWAESTESRLDDQLIPLIRQAARVGVIVVGLLFVLDAVGVDVWKLAAGVGIGGLAFALAAQDTVANVFGSVNIFIDKPFQIGDWVKIGDVEGTVEEVGFRSTRVRTFYNSLVTMPNSAIMNANVDNLGVRPRRRVKLVVGLTYDTPPDKLQGYVEGVRAILAAHPMVQQSYEVHVYDLGSSAIEILVYYHVVVESWTDELETRSQNLLEFIRLAEALEVSFAFPSTSVYVESTPQNPLPPHPTRSLEELQQVAASFGPGGDSSRPWGPTFQRSFSPRALTAEGDHQPTEEEG